MDMIHAAAELGDLRTPPGNRLEALRGGLKGFHSIRINDQWRIIFVGRVVKPMTLKLLIITET